MGYKRTNHKNALFKLVREKGLILQTEAAKRLNRDNSSLKTTAESLVEEGKIKRQKVKQRFKNGNLNDCWLLYMPGTSQNLILKYVFTNDLCTFHDTSSLKDFTSIRYPDSVNK